MEKAVDNVDKPFKCRRQPCKTGASQVSRRHARLILKVLQQSYPDAKCALHHETPWQLLVATILSAQCTDVRVNQVTPRLFARFPDPASLANAHPAEVEELIRSTGFFRNKTANLIRCAIAVLARHDGKVPCRMSELVALPGIGRKTANVVLGNAFEVPGMVVDTHVGRVARRLGWARSSAAEKVEQELCALLPASCWTQASHLLIWHGRRCCRAQTAHCSVCPVTDHCPRVGVGKSR